MPPSYTKSTATTSSSSSLAVAVGWVVPCVISFVAGASSVALLWWYAEDPSFLSGNDDEDYETDTLSSWIVDPWKQSVEDFKSRIGELPKLTRRSHWPWETIRNKVFLSKQTSSLTVDDNHPDEKRQGLTTVTNNSSNDKLNAHGLKDDDSKKQQEQDEEKEQEEEGPPEQKSGFCIGSIFGLDVGGTLAKLVYFEQKSADYDPIIPRGRLYTTATSSASIHSNDSVGIIAGGGGVNQQQQHQNLQNGFHGLRNCLNGSSASGDSSRTSFLRRTMSMGSLKKYNETISQLDAHYHTHDHDHQHHQNESNSHHSRTHHTQMHSNLKSDPFLEPRHESVPKNLHHYGSTRFGSMNGEPTNNANGSKYGSKTAATTTSESSNIKKSKSMFDLSFSRDRAEALDSFYTFARRLDSYRAGVKDHKLSFYSRDLGGEFHFIRYETRQMRHAMDLIRANNLHRNIYEMGATGGGAHKFADDWKRLLGIEMDKQDELESLVAGMQFVLSTVVGECYTYRAINNSNNSNANRTKNADTDGLVGGDGNQSVASSSQAMAFKPNYDSLGMTLSEDDQSGNHSMGPLRMDDSESDKDEENDEKSPKSTAASGGEEENETQKPTMGAGDEWWWSRKVQRDAITYSSTYPYLLVTIGTGVSVLRVDGPRKHERISGSTIGGGTYWGLIRLLTDVEDFEDVMRLAAKGDPSKVDMMVGDIYGRNSDALEKIGLPSNIVASSFGKLVAKEDPAEGLTQEDLARALLLMVTNNIGQVAYLNAKLHNTPRIYFVGNFLRQNEISQRRLSWAVSYWSKGEMEALFLEHEGYFGALGAFLLSQGISSGDHGHSTWKHETTTSSPPTTTSAGVDREDGAASADTMSTAHSAWHKRSKTFGA